MLVLMYYAIVCFPATDSFLLLYDISIATKLQEKGFRVINQTIQWGANSGSGDETCNCTIKQLHNHIFSHPPTRTHTHTHTHLHSHTYSHRGRTYQFDDFLLSWGNKLKTSGEPNALTVRLQKDIDRFQVSVAIMHDSCIYTQC